MTPAARDDPARDTVIVPAGTAAPFVMAFGITLLFAGLVTHVALSIVGLVLACAGAVGWFREVLPIEHREAIAIEPEAVPGVMPRPAVAHLAVGEALHRARLPVEVYPVSAGVKGGIAGGIAMAALALLYGLVGHGSIWYPINLLAAGASASLAASSHDQLLAFNGRGLILAAIIHGIGSVLMGLLYGVLLPMVPRRPILLGGIVAPLMWSGLLRAVLDVVNPTLNQRIDWPWFVASQIAFGVVAGLVVARSERVYTMQHLPFAVRAGIEAPGIPRPGAEE